MQHWREVLPTGRMLEVQYEDIVEDFEAVARRIIAHCGLKEPLNKSLSTRLRTDL